MESDHKTETVVKKFVALGTPFDGSFAAPPGMDLAFDYPNKELGISRKGKAHKALANTDVFVGYHTKQNYVVPEFSQTGIKVANPKYYDEKPYDTDHRGIHELRQVINDVNYFLFQGVK